MKTAIKNLLAAVVIAAGFALSSTGTASAGNLRFWLTNNDARDIYSVRISLAGERNYSDDLLGTDMIESDGRMRIKAWSDEEDTLYDIQITYDGGRPFVLRDVDLCGVSEIEVEGRDAEYYYH